MKTMMTAAAIALGMFALSAQAADDKPASRLGACSKEAAAKGLKGEERTKYLSECNKAEPGAASTDKKGSKLGACSKEAAAKGLKGEERNKYLSECNKKA